MINTQFYNDTHMNYILY